MGKLSATALTALKQSVQQNCCISDARYAREYTLCVYLLRMREYYRWHHQLPFLHKLNVDNVGDWVADQESRWDEIEQHPYQPIRINSQTFDPFDHQSINHSLRDDDLVYSAGIGRLGQPLFTLATLLDYRQTGLIDSFDCGDELARGSVSVPAMSTGSQIIVKRAGVREQIWNMYDEWLLRRNPGPMARVVAHFGFVRDESLEDRLTLAANELTPLFVAHERGEVQAGSVLGDSYREMTASTAGSTHEHYFRAVRDLLADTTATWPTISRQASPLYLDFWLASLSGIRLELMKKTNIYPLLSTDRGDTQLQRLRQVTAFEQHRWRIVCLGLLSAFQRADPADRNNLSCADIIAELI